ncbi:putative Transcription factor [Melia azedarach]|uniref:Transcription factor n=1 Tax=Melia azedarach TaxID=155640 RepID=A0ACC1WT09_MELAZ|nr:putative Transcription factor [Melia azedarach]
MGEDCGSWFPQKQFDWRLPNLNYLSAPNHLEQQNSVPSIMNPGTNMVSTNGTFPVNAYPVQPHLQVVQSNEPHGWFYRLPRQAFMPGSNSLLKEQLPAGPFENCRETIKPKAGSGCTQKRFLVFDQSGDQTTLILSSGIGTPVQCLTSWSPKPLGGYNLTKEIPRAKGEANFHSGPNLIDELDETNGTDLQSEMHEDTEELNALLYSDDDSDYTDDDEVTSTGHSPSTTTAHEKPDWFDGSTEEVASSAGPSKKRKLFDADHDDVPSPMVSTSSVRFNPHFDNEDDAESSCGNSQNPGSCELGYPSSYKRMRKEKIRETVSVLRSIIPDGKGKDAVLVLDEAIDYLKSLKHKAKSFGLDSL